MSVFAGISKFHTLSQFDGSVDRELEKLGGTLGDPAHGRVERFVPAGHPWFVGTNEDFAPQEKARLFLFDHEIL